MNWECCSLRYMWHVTVTLNDGGDITWGRRFSVANLGDICGLLELHFMDNRLNGVIRASLDIHLWSTPEHHLWVSQILYLPKHSVSIKNKLDEVQIHLPDLLCNLFLCLRYN